jgi:modification methylase
MENKKSIHKIIIGAAQNMKQIANNSVELVVTSPPYPMIEMWDDIMTKQNAQIGDAIRSENGHLTFQLMHKELDKVWKEVERVLIPGGFACINIGDATRTIKKEFQLYPNHSRIISSFHELGMSNLPNILWRKQTNAPNKFMGSGMMPSGAYVTLEHEWILVFRKGGKRNFSNTQEKLRRRNSSFFWEERNVWFSDLWDLKGTKQNITKSVTRKRSAAYPFEIPYRLINMYSLQNDTVLDPFLGTGTTSLAAMVLKRNSIGYEIDETFKDIIMENLQNNTINDLNEYIENRIIKHSQFVEKRESDTSKKPIKHFNEVINMPVMTKQETGIVFYTLSNITKGESDICVSYQLADVEDIVRRFNADKQLDIFS